MIKNLSGSKMKATVIECPRCKLPQKQTQRCQYCGYILSKKRLHQKTIRTKLKDLIVALRKNQTYPAKKAKLTGSGEARSGRDRRKYLVMNYYPERRSGKDRRKRIDHRRQAARKRS
jgi:ribosomal protein L37E